MALPAQTALDVIKSAMRLINVLASGEEPTAAEASDGLMVLNQMLDGWNADQLAIFTEQFYDFPFVGGKQAYTLGTGGDFNMERPPQLERMSVVLLNNPANPIELPIALYSTQDWQEKLPVKAVSSTFPLTCYDDGGFPLRTLNFWPLPWDSINKVRIYAWQPLAGCTTLKSQVSFPPGYAEAVRYNLAVRMAPEFNNASVPDVVAVLARQSLDRIKVMNTPDVNLRSDLLSGAEGYNTKADLFGIPW